MNIVELFVEACEKAGLGPEHPVSIQTLSFDITTPHFEMTTNLGELKRSATEGKIY